MPRLRAGMDRGVMGSSYVDFHTYAGPGGSASFDSWGSPAQQHASPPKPAKWLEGDECKLCKRRFGAFTRQHHCRRCGAAVCKQCSPGRLRLPQIGITAPVRVCVSCSLEVKSEEDDDLGGGYSSVSCFADVSPVVDRIATSWTDLELDRAEDGGTEVEMATLQQPPSPRRSLRVEIQRGEEGWGVSFDGAGTVTDVALSPSGGQALSPGARVVAVDAEPVEGGAAIVAALEARDKEGEAVLTLAPADSAALAEPAEAAAAPALPVLRVQRHNWSIRDVIAEESRKFRVVCEFPPTEEDPAAAVYWVAASDDETQIRAIYQDCVENTLQPLLSPVIAHQQCQDCGSADLSHNLPDQTTGRWCKECAAANHRGAIRVVCHTVWLRELKRLVTQRRVVRNSRKRPYAAALRLAPGSPSSVEENHAALAPGVYTFEIWFDQGPSALR